MLSEQRRRGSRRWAWLLLVAGTGLWWMLGSRFEARQPPAPISVASPGRGADPAPRQHDRAAARLRSAAAPGAGSAPRVADPALGGDGEVLPRWLSRVLGERVHTGGALVSNRSPALAAAGASDFDPRDLAVLAELIDANGLGEGSSASDFDDGNGRLDPWELGYQVWQDGRLVALSLGPDPHASFGYELAVVPESIGVLDALVQLDLSGNRIESLPDAIGELRALSELRANRNHLGELPASLGELRELRALNVSQNRLRGLPDETRGLDSLEELYLDDNPIAELPESVLELDSLERVSVTHEAEDLRAGVETGGGLATLPSDGLAARTRPLVLVVGGNRLCDPMMLAGLASAGHVQVFGLSAQRCAGFASR